MTDSDIHHNLVSFVVRRSDTGDLAFQDEDGDPTRNSVHADQDYMPNDREGKVTPPTVAERGRSLSKQDSGDGTTRHQIFRVKICSTR